VTYKCFKRTSWRNNPSWPEGLEPAAVSPDDCRTLATFDDYDEARDWCQDRNYDLPTNDRAKRLGGMYEFISI